MINLFWYDEGFNNLGDSINPSLVQKLSGKEIKRTTGKELHYVAVGSIFDRVNQNSIVWGTGVVSPEVRISKPHSILAVRGPSTREHILNQGWECPEVYGDPVLLLPEVYQPDIPKRYDVGIIPHYIDKDNEWVSNQNAFIIDITKDPFDVVDDILRCDRILSSSLHGLIVADAYGIPSVWIELSDKVVGKGFKFRDYFRSTNRVGAYCDLRKDDVSLSQICSLETQPIDIDLELLKSVCPFHISP